MKKLLLVSLMLVGCEVKFKEGESLLCQTDKEGTLTEVTLINQSKDLKTCKINVPIIFFTGNVIGHVEGHVDCSLCRINK